MTCYVFDMAIQNQKRQHIYTMIAGGLLLGYVLLVIFNIGTGWVFRFDSTELRSEG